MWFHCFYFYLFISLDVGAHSGSCGKWEGEDIPCV